MRAPRLRRVLPSVGLCALLLTATGCAAPRTAVVLGDGTGTTTAWVCVPGLDEPMTFGESLRLADDAGDITLERVELVDAVGVRVLEQAIAAPAVEADGTVSAIGFERVADAGAPWTQRRALAGTVIRGGDTETYSVGLALEATQDGPVGFEAIRLVYSDDTGELATRGTTAFHSECAPESED